MPYIEIRMDYDVWCKERGLDTQAFVDRMLGECIRGEQENEAKEAARIKAEEEKIKQAAEAKKHEFRATKAEKTTPELEPFNVEVEEEPRPEETKTTVKKKKGKR